MQKEERFTIGRQKSYAKEQMYLEGYGKRWGDKPTFTVGLSYLSFGLVGLVAGFIQSKDVMAKHTQLKAYHSMNNVGRQASRYANGAAACTLLFCVSGKVIDLLFEEELLEYGGMWRNLGSAFLTGAIYKSTLGLRPMIVGSIMGVGTVFGLTHGFNFLNDKGIIGFRVDI